MRRYLSLLLALAMLISGISLPALADAPTEVVDTQTEESAPAQEPDPTAVPTEKPTDEPTNAPTDEPTAVPTDEPTAVPTDEPTEAPASEPEAEPTELPSDGEDTEGGEGEGEPTEAPTEGQPDAPDADPTSEPTARPEPTEQPSEPEPIATEKPAAPTDEPTSTPTDEPTAAPTDEPTPAPFESGYVYVREKTAAFTEAIIDEVRPQAEPAGVFPAQCAVYAEIARRELNDEDSIFRVTFDTAEAKALALEDPEAPLPCAYVRQRDLIQIADMELIKLVTALRKDETARAYIINKEISVLLPEAVFEPVPAPTTAPEATAEPTAAPDDDDPLADPDGDAVIDDKAAITITTQPSNATAEAGANVRLSVTASNVANYAWQYSADGGKTWTNIGTSSSVYTGSNTRTLTFSMTSGKDEYRYRCVLSNSSSTVNSTAAIVSLLLPITITTQPVDRVARADANVTFSVSAKNATAWQWYYSTDEGVSWKKIGATSTAFSGGTAKTLSFTQNSTRAQYAYRCEVSNSKDSKVTNTVHAKLYLPIEITTQPTDKQAKADATVTFSVTAKNVDAYQWYYSSDNGETWKKIGASSSAFTGGTTKTLSFTQNTTRSAWKYKCELSNEFVTKDTNIVNAILLLPIEITTQPVSRDAKAGATVTFSMTAKNATAYQWYYSKDSGSNWSKIAETSSTFTGGTTRTLSFKQTSTLATYMFKCVASNSQTSKDSNKVVARLVLPIEITSQPTNAAGATGAWVKFSVAANNATAYKWQRSSDNGSTWSDVSDGSSYSNSATKTLSVLISSSTASYRYRCHLSSAGDSRNSTSAKILLPASITTQPSNQSGYVDSKVSFSVTATGATSYKWQVSKDGGSTWQNLSSSWTGYCTSKLSFTVTATLATYKYRVAVINAAGTVYSRAVTVSIPLPGTPGKPSLKATGNRLDVTWTAAAGATGYVVYYGTSSSISSASSVTVGNVLTKALTGLTYGKTYYVWVKAKNSTGTGSASSSNSILIIPEGAYYDTVVTSGSDLNIRDTAGGTKIGSAPNGATVIVLEPGASWTKIIYNGITGYVSTSYLKLTPNRLPPTITVQPSSRSGYAGSNVTFTVTATNAKSYRWQYSDDDGSTWKNVSTSWTGYASSALTFEVNVARSAYLYRVVVSNDYGTVESNAVSLTIPVPGAPGGPTLTTSGTTIDVSWTAATGATGYVIYYNTTNSTSGATTITVGNVLSRSITGLSYSTTYYVWVRAKNSTGLGSSTSVKSIKTETKTLPVPTWGTLSATTNTITVSWSTVSGASGYTLYYGTGTTISTATSRNVGNVSSYTITGLSSKTTYYLWIKAYSGDTTSAASNRASITTDAQRSVTVTANRSTAAEGDTVTFTSSVQNMTGTITYRWQQSSDGSSWSNTSLSGYSSSTLSFSATQSRLSYKYRLAVTDSAGTWYSNTVSVRYLRGIVFNELTYSFGNSYRAYNYSSTYRIPLSRYKRFLSDTDAQQAYDRAGKWGGNCFGMSTTASMLFEANTSLKPSWFGRSINKDMKVTDYSSTLSMNVTEMIETAQVMQYAMTFYYESIADVISAVKASETSGEPVVISVYSEDSGHAIVGLSVDRISSTETRVNVYDPNYPLTAGRYIKVTTNTSGTPQSWSYKINDEDPCISLSYKTFSQYKSTWQSGRGLIAGVSTLYVDADSFDIKNSSGSVVAKMRNGSFSSSDSDIRYVKPIDVNTNGYMVRLPSGTYTIVNRGSGSMSVDMANNDRRAIVDTTADSVTVKVSKSASTDRVVIDAASGESYSVKLTSENDTYGTVEYTGRGDGSDVVVGVVDGELQLRNGDSAKLSVNGVRVPTSGLAITDKDSSASVAFNVTERSSSSVTVRASNSTGKSVKGEMVVAAFDDDGNMIAMTMRHVSLSDGGSASLTLSGANGAAEIRAYILDSNSFSVIGNTAVFN